MEAQEAGHDGTWVCEGFPWYKDPDIGTKINGSTVRFLLFSELLLHLLYPYLSRWLEILQSPLIVVILTFPIVSPSI